MLGKSIKSLFGSNTRVKLLELFFSNSDNVYYVREITRLIDEQINSVRRELSNLEEAKVIKKTKRDNKVYYGINPKFKNYIPFAMIFDDNFDRSSLSKDTITEIAKEANLPDEKQITKIDWAKLADRVAQDLKIFVLAGDLVSDSKSELDMLIIGNNNQGNLSTWANQLEKIKGQSLNYAILDYDDFYYRYSVKDKFVMDVFSTKHSIIKDEFKILK